MKRPRNAHVPTLGHAALDEAARVLVALAAGDHPSAVLAHHDGAVAGSHRPLAPPHFVVHDAHAVRRGQHELHERALRGRHGAGDGGGEQQRAALVHPAALGGEHAVAARAAADGAIVGQRDGGGRVLHEGSDLAGEGRDATQARRADGVYVSAAAPVPTVELLVAVQDRLR